MEPLQQVEGMYDKCLVCERCGGPMSPYEYETLGGYCVHCCHEAGDC